MQNNYQTVVKCNWLIILLNLANMKDVSFKWQWTKKDRKIKMSHLDTVLTIAGTDPSGGAGAMADLKSFQARETYGMAVITSIVAQNTQGVKSVMTVDGQMIRDQLDVVFEDIPPQAVKSGMLATPEMIKIVGEYLRKFKKPYILDPVMVATSGDRLISEEAVEELKQELLPLATLVTPNLPEAEVLVSYPLKDDLSIIKAGFDIQSKYQVKNVLIKGGHSSGKAKDFLFLEDEGLITLNSERINTKHTHGTGCTYAAVCAAEMAKGRTVQEAVQLAKAFITCAIKTAPELGHGNGPVNHVTFKGE